MTRARLSSSLLSSLVVYFSSPSPVTSPSERRNEVRSLSEETRLNSISGIAIWVTEVRTLTMEDYARSNSEVDRLEELEEELTEEEIVIHFLRLRLLQPVTRVLPLELTVTEHRPQ